MKRNPQYAGLPDTILGLSCSQHRTSRIKQILDYYEVHYLARAKKAELLVELAEFTQTFQLDGQEARLARWLKDGAGPEVLARYLRDENENESDIEPPSRQQVAENRPSHPSRISIATDNFFSRKRSLKEEDEEEEQKHSLPGRPRKIARSNKRTSAHVPNFECGVCLEQFPTTVLLKQGITPSCKHEPTVCSDCLTMHLNLQIAEKGSDAVACPLCPEILTFESVKMLATPESFERYDAKQMQEMLSTMPNFARCLGPNCSSGQIHDGGDEQPIMTCISCQFKTCYTHQLPWHDGQTCAEYDDMHAERVRQEEQTEAYLSDKTKKCPNPDCGMNVTKISGCDHMTCHQCNYEYCWICFASYTEIRRHGNSAHKQDCRYHTDNLPRAPPNVLPQAYARPPPVRPQRENVHQNRPAQTASTHIQPPIPGLHPNNAPVPQAGPALLLSLLAANRFPPFYARPRNNIPGDHPDPLPAFGAFRPFEAQATAPRSTPPVSRPYMRTNAEASEETPRPIHRDRLQYGAPFVTRNIVEAAQNVVPSIRRSNNPPPTTATPLNHELPVFNNTNAAVPQNNSNLHEEGFPVRRTMPPRHYESIFDL